MKQWGKAVILSDSDVVFQPRKIERSGLFEAVEGSVPVYLHKEQELDDVERRYPRDYDVVVDGKLKILTAVKKVLGARVTTVFPRQGHYARDPRLRKSYPPADVSMDRIGDVLRYDLPQLVGASTREP